MSNTANTAFVTGATGFVGSNLLRQLEDDGWQVTALCRSLANAAQPGPSRIQWVQGDITDLESLCRGIPQDVNAVFHLAADTSVWSRGDKQQELVNVGGTRNVVEAALRAKADKLVMTSTVSAYGRHDEPISESTPSTAAASWISYERTKWLAEEEVRKGVDRGLNATIINPCAIIGPGDTQSWAQFFFMLQDGRLKGIPPGTATFNHVRSVVDAHVSAVDLGKSGENYLLGGDVAKFEALLQLMAECLGVSVKAKVVPEPLLKFVGQISGVAARFTGKEPDMTPEMASLMSQDVLLATDKAEKELGYTSLPLRTGVEESYNWLVGEGLLTGSQA